MYEVFDDAGEGTLPVTREMREDYREVSFSKFEKNDNKESTTSLPHQPSENNFRL